jgi:hypothetical protein
MTQKLYVGTKADCGVIREALDVAFGYPVPGNVNGQPIVNAQQRAEKTAQWWALTLEQRDSGAFDSLWSGWTMRYSMPLSEWPPGLKAGCWVPANMQTAFDAASSGSRQLTIAQTTALIAAGAASLLTYPANWLTEPEPA